jgi:hypothetical protein
MRVGVLLVVVGVVGAGCGEEEKSTASYACVVETIRENRGLCGAPHNAAFRSLSSPTIRSSRRTGILAELRATS